MTRHHLRTLGRLSLHEGGREGEVVLSDAKALAALAYLADTPDGSADRSHLARLLWPGKATGRARAGLRQALYYLRRKTAAGVSLLRTDGERAALDRDELEVDLWAFEEALSGKEWERVLDLYGGPFLGGYDVEGAEEFRHWREGREAGIRAGFREACRALVSRGLGEDEPERAVRAARRWVDLNPLDESAQEALVRSLVAAGDRAGAFRAYESYRSLLREELAESPGPRLSGVLEELRSLAEGAPPGAAAAGEGRETSGDWEPERIRAAGAAEDRWAAAGGGSPSALRRGLSAAVLALAVLLLAAAGWRMLGGDGEETGGPAAAVEILVRTESTGGEPAVRTILWTGDSVRIEGASIPEAHGVPAPDGDRAAVVAQGLEGADLALESPGGGGRRILAATEADEIPVAWSPDGERILYHAGRTEEEGTYVRRYRVHRLEDGSDRTLGLPVGPTGSSRRHGDWSPLGPAIAVVSDSAGSLDVWTVNTDGTAARNLTSDHAGRDVEPAFSPEGRRIAFVSDRSGNPDVWVMDADGGNLRRLTWSLRPEREPVWLDPRRIGYFRILGDGGALFRSVDLSTGADRPLVELPGFTAGLMVRRPVDSPSWIASVELPGHLARVGPGQWVRRRATVRDARGETLPEGTVPLDWSVSDDSVVDPGPRGGWLRVRAPGYATLRIDAGGWRSDSLHLSSAAPELRDLSPALREDWTAGLDSSRWISLGEPAPVVVRSGGRFRGALTSRGDENYHSGVITRRALRLDEGLTVECWGRAPYTRPHYQSLIIGLLSRVPDREPATWGAPQPIVEISASMETSDSLGVTLENGFRRVPAPDSVATWHRYTLQLDATGRVSLLVDGRMHWRSDRTVAVDRLDGAHLALYGRSKDTRILHGPVTVWEGVRYRLP